MDDYLVPKQVNKYFPSYDDPHASKGHGGVFSPLKLNLLRAHHHFCEISYEMITNNTTSKINKNLKDWLLMMKF